MSDKMYILLTEQELKNKKIRIDTPIMTLDWLHKCHPTMNLAFELVPVKNEDLRVLVMDKALAF